MFARFHGICLLVISSNVLAVYDPAAPHGHENFDPAEANPAHQIKCFGDRPEIELPVFPDWNPNEHTVQQLCAKPQYGGLAKHKHVGGFCAGFVQANYLGPGRGLVAFDDSSTAQTSAALWNMEVLLYCRTRCFCVSELVGEAQPLLIPNWDEAAFGPLSLGREDRTYQIKMEKTEFWGTMESHRGKTGYLVPRTAIWKVREIQYMRKATRPRFEQVSIAPGNDPICKGPLPEFSLPGAYSASDFANIQSFCAVQLAGGNPSANAGMYCHRRDPKTYGSGEPSRYLWFSEQMTPRPDWTLDNLFESLRIRYHCNVYCKCPEPLDSTTEPDTTEVDVAEWDMADKDLRLKYGLTVVGEADGSLVIFGAHGMSKKIIPKQRPGEPAASSETCSADGKQSCPVPWPEDLYGPKPRAPPLPEYNGRPSRLPVPKIRYCGTDCHSAADCNNSPDIPSGAHCSCTIPHTEFQFAAALSRGEDPVFPRALCGIIGIAALGSTRGKLNGYNIGGILGRRSVDDDNDYDSDYDKTESEEGRGAFDHACVCNTTYISRACCDSSKNGMVWEDRGFKLGVLKTPDEIR